VCTIFIYIEIIHRSKSTVFFNGRNVKIINKICMAQITEKNLASRKVSIRVIIRYWNIYALDMHNALIIQGFLGVYALALLLFFLRSFFSPSQRCLVFSTLCSRWLTHEADGTLTGDCPHGEKWRERARSSASTTPNKKEKCTCIPVMPNYTASRKFVASIQSVQSFSSDVSLKPRDVTLYVYTRKFLPANDIVKRFFFFIFGVISHGISLAFAFNRKCPRFKTSC